MNNPTVFDSDGTPLQPDGNPMKRFETRLMPGENGDVRKAVYIDGEWLDWSVDVSSLFEAKKMGPKFYQAALKDIEKHFVESVSEVLGRKVTAQEITKATKVGWI